MAPATGVRSGCTSTPESRWEVVDQGTWLAGEDIEPLFRPFQRSESPLERRGSGAGLGLTVARSAAGAVGGTAGGEVRGRTTVFWLAVPRPGRGRAHTMTHSGVPRTGADDTLPVTTRALPASRDDTITRVFVVDDHTVTRHGIVLLCEAAEGIEVVGEAGNGHEAVERVPELLPDIVLMDVDMPKLGGIEATRQIRQTYPSVGVVILTVHENQETVFEAIKAGASGYLPKSSSLRRDP